MLSQVKSAEKRVANGVTEQIKTLSREVLKFSPVVTRMGFENELNRQLFDQA